MHIEIEIPRPALTLLVLAAATGWGLVLTRGLASPAAPVADLAHTHDEFPVSSASSSDANTAVVPDAQGGDDTPPQHVLAEAQLRALQAREEQSVLMAKEDILRLQLQVLADERRDLGAKVDPALEEQFRQGTRMLVELAQDERRAEQFLLTSFNEMWEAENRAIAAAPGAPPGGQVMLQWPVNPLLGISAYFLDKSYEATLKMRHYAIDIPVMQGTSVRAAAGGIVADVIDHGLGFSYITIEHPGGYSTLYGHLSGFAVTKGQHVVAGDEIGTSGGRPGTRGAGLSTGPHLHFGLHMSGAAIDPLQFLPPHANVRTPDEGSETIAPNAGL